MLLINTVKYTMLYNTKKNNMGQYDMNTGFVRFTVKRIPNIDLLKLCHMALLLLQYNFI